MEATARLAPRGGLTAAIPTFDLEAATTWLLAFGLVIYLGLKGGGFDPIVSDKIGIVVWWAILAGLLIGAFPRHRLGIPGWTGLALLAAFLGWTALSLIWTESSGNTSAEIARVATYLGVLFLALSLSGSGGVRRMVAAVGCGIAVIATVALLSRLHPAWFPDAAQTGNFLQAVRNRLSYPLNYWNAVAALTAVGLPLLLHLATTGRSVLLRSLAAAALPSMALTIYFTLSRGGILAAVTAVGVYIAFAGDRLPRLTTASLAAVGGAILIGAASQRDALQSGLLNGTAQHQGTEMLWMAIVVCLAVGLIQAAISTILLNELRPGWTVPSRRVSIASAAAAVAVVIAAAAAINLPHRIANGVGEFKSGDAARGGAARLTSAAGEQRYKLWASALDEFAAEPFHGTGAGTFELWWARNGNYSQTVRDTHSLYLQTLGELGIVGIILFGAFVVVVIGTAGWAALQTSARGSPDAAAAGAAILAFLVGGALDWTWKIPVLPVAVLLLAGAVLATARSSDGGRPRIPLALRGALALIAVAVIVGVAIPLSSTQLIRESQDQAAAADLPAALQSARSAANVEPDAGLPRLQQALIFEQAGDYRSAVSEASAATGLEATNWKNWLILSRVQAEAGQADAALRSYRMAASLNPNSPIFER